MIVMAVAYRLAARSLTAAALGRGSPGGPRDHGQSLEMPLAKMGMHVFQPWMAWTEELWLSFLARLGLLGRRVGDAIHSYRPQLSPDAFGGLSSRSGGVDFWPLAL